jgi:hypothetical protein
MIQSDTPQMPDRPAICSPLTPFTNVPGLHEVQLPDIFRSFSELWSTMLLPILDKINQVVEDLQNGDAATVSLASEFLDNVPLVIKALATSLTNVDFGLESTLARAEQLGCRGWTVCIWMTPKETDSLCSTVSDLEAGAFMPR